MQARALCLNMIVRNETANLARCLGAVAPHIACWVIGDTGSTDGTQDLIRAFFDERGIPGELHEFPFINFEQARNEALDRALRSRLAFDYLLLADADMELVVDDAEFRSRLEGKCYDLIQYSGVSYWNARIVRRDAQPRYRGVTHEYLEVAGGGKQLTGLWYQDHASGANREDKLERDTRLLTEGLAQEPENARYWFYLAQTYRDAGKLEAAAETYAKRAAMGGWAEEAWYARLQRARCLKRAGKNEEFLAEAVAAFNQRPHRGEPLYELARFYRERGMHEAAALYAEAGLVLPWPKQDTLFVEDFVYTTGLREEYSICANYSRDPARKDRGFAACNWLALNRDVAGDPRRLARYNLRFYVGSAERLMPSFVARPVAFAPPEGYRAMNPSIARDGDRLVMAQHCVNYELTDDGRYATPGGRRAHTRNYLLQLGDGLEVESAAEILPPAGMQASSSGRLQDPRLFAWRGALWCTAGVWEFVTGRGEQMLARIEAGRAGECRLADWRMLRFPGATECEKNWMPCVQGDALHLIQLCDPTRVLDGDAQIITEHRPAIAADEFRGGTQAVAFDGGWLAVVHEVLTAPQEQTRIYHHRFVQFESGWVLQAVSRPFFFLKRGVELACGLAWHPDGTRLIVSFGVANREAWTATVDARDVRALLCNVAELPTGAPHPTPEQEVAAAAECSPGPHVAQPYRRFTPPNIPCGPIAARKSPDDTKRILFYSDTQWALGLIHSSLCTHLRAAGWTAEMKSWSKGYNVAEFAQEASTYDYVVTLPFGGTRPLDSYRVPRDKIIIVAHDESDIQRLVAAEGVEGFERFAAYGVVSDTLACSSISLGIKRLPLVVRYGVDIEKYRREIPARLSSVGYATVTRRPTVSGLERKRGELAQACAEAAGLRFDAVANRPFDTMPDFYGSVDSLVMPSLQEGAGLPPLEAAAAGRLVIGTPVGHFPRLAYEGLGILAPLDADAFRQFTVEKLIYYRDNPAAYVDKCAATLEAARQRDWRYTVADWIELFSSAR